jgi:hypothetical protein
MEANREVAMDTRTAHEPLPEVTAPDLDDFVVEDDVPAPAETEELPLEADPADVLDQRRALDEEVADEVADEAADEAAGAE